MSKKRSFTLIELLVVIAIISILMMILLPSLKRAKEKARTAYCISNLKQQGTVFMSYVQDYDDYLPAINEPHPIVGLYYWPRYLGGQVLGYFPNAIEAKETIVICPSDDNPMNHGPMFYSYGRNIGSCSTNGGAHRKLRASLKSETMLVTDTYNSANGRASYYCFSLAPTQVVYVDAGRHSGTVNVLSVGSSVNTWMWPLPPSGQNSILWGTVGP